MKQISRAVLLDQYETRIESHLKTVIANFQNLTETTLLKPAANGGWSVAQCLEHLNSYGRYYLPAIQKGLASEGDSTVSYFKSSWLGAYFTKLMEPGSKSKAMKSPKDHAPAVMLDAANVIATFIEQQELLLHLLRKSAMKDMNHIRIPISISRWIKLKLGDVFGFLIAHDERHIQQALRHLK